MYARFWPRRWCASHCAGLEPVASRKRRVKLAGLRPQARANPLRQTGLKPFHDLCRTHHLRHREQARLPRPFRIRCSLDQGLEPALKARIVRPLGDRFRAHQGRQGRLTRLNGRSAGKRVEGLLDLFGGLSALREQARLLDQDGIPWRVIPGVTAACAAAAADQPWSHTVCQSRSVLFANCVGSSISHSESIFW